jgi:Zn-dependent M16 (insulinase) family peptidase
MTQSLLNLNYAVEDELTESKRKVFEEWLSLTRTQFALVQCEEEDVTDKENELRLGLGSLSRSLRDYFSCQENLFSSFLDKSSIRTIVIEHGDIMEQVDAAKDVVAKLSWSNRRRSPTMIAHVQKSITDIRRRVEEDAIKEELVLQLLMAEPR